MSVEGGSIGGAGGIGGGIGGSIGAVGVGVSMGPGIGSFAGTRVEAGLTGRFGPSISGPDSFASLPAIVESPVSLADFKNTMPYKPGGIGNTSPEPLLPQDEIEAVKAAEDIVSQAQQPLVEKDVVVEAKHWQEIGNTVPDITSIPSLVIPAPCRSTGSTPAGIYTNNYLWIPDQVRDDRSGKAMSTLQVNPVIVPRPVEATNPTILDTIVEQNVGTQTRLQLNTENKVATLEIPAVSTQPASQGQEAGEEIEEIVEERVQQGRPEEGSEEEQVAEKRLYLKDEEALSQRKSEIRQAVIKARTEANRLGLKKIAGWLVAKFLPAEHEGNRSEVVKKTGPDGSYQETVEAVAGAGEFESEERAVTMFDQVAEEKKPVRFGKEGKPVENQDVARVFKYRIVKPAQPFVEVITRVIKKRVSQVGQSSIPIAEPVRMETTKPETNLKDLGLAGVFQNAA